jgi:ribosome biogenesis protein MAK21
VAARARRRGSEREAAAAPPAREAKRERAGGKAAAATSAADADDAAPRAPQPRKGRRDWAFGAGPAPAPPALDAPASGGARDRTGVWFVDAASLPPLPPAPRGGPPLDVSALRAEGAAALAAEEAGGGRGNRTTAEAAWLRVVRTAGTGADRVAAATVQAQRDPIAHGRALDSLLEMCAGARAAGGKRAAGQALDALRELFALHLLPDRKLRRFEEQPLAAVAALRPGDSRRAAHLLYWHYEAALKAKFGRFVEALLELSRDPLEWLKERAVAAAAALLRAKPEGEAPLLRLLVNKLGDPGRKAASAAAYQLAQLLAAHPAMKGVVVREVGHFAFRPRIGLRAQYTAVVFVSQLALSHRGADPAVAEQMITLYFDLFQSLLAAPIEAGAAADGAFRGKGSPAAGVAAKAKAGGKKGGKGSGKPKKKGTEGPAGPDAVADASVGVDSRLLRALLTGINRALPYVPAEAADALVERVSPAVYRIAHGSSLGAACQALALLYQMMASKAAASDRFYRALYDALLAPALPRSASAAMFLALLFRAARADVNPKRVAAIIKRLLQVRPACAAHALGLLRPE